MQTATHPPPLIDIGANLTHDAFGHDLDAVLARAQAAGVIRMVVTGADRQSSYDAMALAKSHSGVLYATAGVHPHHAADYDAATDADIRQFASADAVRAVGETGLDYYRNFSPHAAQRTALEKQLAIAIELKMPVFLHQRDAHADFLAIMKNARPHLPAAVVHCFTDTRAALADYLDLDCHIGITGWICDERRGTHLRELVREIPADRLMLETDAPYLLPRDLHPKPPHRRNEPAYLAHICQVLARHRGEDPAVTAAHSSATADAFFGMTSDHSCTAR